MTANPQPDAAQDSLARYETEGLIGRLRFPLETAEREAIAGEVFDRYVTLRQHIATLTSERDEANARNGRNVEYHGQRLVEAVARAETAERKLAAAEAREAEAAKDAARWRFVRDHWHDLCTATGVNDRGQYAVLEIFIGVGEHAPFAAGSVEAAIDAHLQGGTP